jgi:hypothetical protein
MDRRLIRKIEKLLSWLILPVKRLRYRQQKGLVCSLIEHGASLEEIKKEQVRLRGYRNRIYSLERLRGTGEPPLLGELLLSLILLSKEDRDNILGDLIEEYRKMETKWGRRYADRWFYGQVLRSVWPLIRRALWWLLLAWIRRRI